MKGGSTRTHQVRRGLAAGDAAMEPADERREHPAGACRLYRGSGRNGARR